MYKRQALTNVVTAGITGGNNQQLTVVDEALVSVAEFSPLVVVVNADPSSVCLLYTSDAADERSSVDLGGRRIINKTNSI